MNRILSVTAAALIACTAFAAAPNNAEARTCKVVSAKATSLSERSADKMAMRRSNRRVNRFARRNKSKVVWVRSYGTDCKKSGPVARCAARTKACV